MSISKFLDLKALKGAKASSGGNRNYFKPGEFLCVVEGVKFDEKRKGKVPYFAAQLKIVHSMPDDPTSQEMAVGKTADYYVGSDNDWYLGNIKQFLEAILGVSQAEIDALSEADFGETVEALFGAGQGAAGQYVYVTCRAGVTKTGARVGQPNAIPNFYHPKPDQFIQAGLSPTGSGMSTV